MAPLKVSQRHRTACVISLAVPVAMVSVLLLICGILMKRDDISASQYWGPLTASVMSLVASIYAVTTTLMHVIENKYVGMLGFFLMGFTMMVCFVAISFNIGTSGLTVLALASIIAGFLFNCALFVGYTTLRGRVADATPNLNQTFVGAPRPPVPHGPGSDVMRNSQGHHDMSQLGVRGLSDLSPPSYETYKPPPSYVELDFVSSTEEPPSYEQIVTKTSNL